MIATSRLRLALGPSCLLGFLVSLTVGAAGGCAKVSMTNPVGGGSGGTIGSMVTIPGLTGLTVSVSPPTIALSQSNGQIVPGTASVAAVANLQDGTTLDATNKVTWILTPSLGMIQGGVLTVSTPGIFTIMATTMVRFSSYRLVNSCIWPMLEHPRQRLPARPSTPIFSITGASTAGKRY